MRCSKTSRAPPAVCTYGCSLFIRTLPHSYCTVGVGWEKKRAMLRVSAGREAEKPQPRCFDASPVKLIQLLIGLNGFNGFNFLFDGGEKPPLVVPHLGHKLSGSVNPLIYCAEIRSGNEFSRDSGRRQMETLAANHLNFSTFLFFCFVFFSFSSCYVLFWFSWTFPSSFCLFQFFLYICLLMMMCC